MTLPLNHTVRGNGSGSSPNKNLRFEIIQWMGYHLKRKKIKELYFGARNGKTTME